MNKLGQSLAFNRLGTILGFMALKPLVKRGGKYYDALIDEPVRLAQHLGTVLLIKGVVDVIVSPDSDDVRIVAERGQPKRSAGQGDILAGILVALLASSAK